MGHQSQGTGLRGKRASPGDHLSLGSRCGGGAGRRTGRPPGRTSSTFGFCWDPAWVAEVLDSWWFCLFWGPSVFSPAQWLPFGAVTQESPRLSTGRAQTDTWKVALFSVLDITNHILTTEPCGIEAPCLFRILIGGLCAQRFLVLLTLCFKSKWIFVWRILHLLFPFDKGRKCFRSPFVTYKQLNGTCGVWMSCNRHHHG